LIDLSKQATITTMNGKFFMGENRSSGEKVLIKILQNENDA